LKRGNNLPVLFGVFAAGIASVAAQLVIIREFLASFEGNEFVISLVLMVWLLSSGMGSLAAVFFRPGARWGFERVLGVTAGLLSILPGILILVMRSGKNIFFVQGASVGFYPTLAVAFGVISPYALLVGLLVPVGLSALRSTDTRYHASVVYALDCLGAAAGGAAFSLALVHLFTPVGTLFAMNCILAAAAWVLLVSSGTNKVPAAAWLAAILLVNALTVGLEPASLRPKSGELVSYRESCFGRLMLTRDSGLYTIFIDGVPALSGQDPAAAEEAAHYALGQLGRVDSVLLVSSVAGIADEVAKYRPRRVDHAQLDPNLSHMEALSGLMKPAKGLNVVHQDARAYLKDTDRKYDAILVNYPEPKTFQTNRYFTREFMELARDRLNPGGVLGFSVQGYDAYLSPAGRLQASSLYNTARSVFPEVLVLPGQRTFFIAGDAPLREDIPGLLAHKGIETKYISGYYAADVSPERISGLKRLLDPEAPVNHDLRPYLMRIAYEGWFAQYASYPYWFLAAAGVFLAVYLLGLRRDEFVLFTSGCVNMGSEILTIFCFQILFGFIYVKLSLVITFFMAGLIPGALFGGRLTGGTRRGLIMADALMIVLLLLFAGVLAASPNVLNEVFFYAFAFFISVLCGFEFPLVAASEGTAGTVARAFSADLVGASLGAILLSALVIPFFGIIAACHVLITCKLASIIVQVSHGKPQPKTVPAR